ncbi:cytochrome P450 9e2-like [Leptopilina heterotoma]|uniref:cytochrome P450 9e2-like n=1 Tax=Leptopilina heterotoma TaxID=63436 RepID=UPI001CA82D1B|nr:cytochrome P450 9e2-like [Leptopilina heterotoma]
MFLLFLIFVIAIIGYCYLLLNRHQNYWKRKGLISHLKPSPLFGNIFPIFIKRSVSMPEFSCQVYNNFLIAKYIGIMQFHTPVIILRDPNLIRDVCIKDFDNFPDHESLIPPNADPLLGKNLFFLQGDRWKEMRHTLSPSFTGSKMKFMFDLVSKCSQNFVKYFLENSDETNVIEMKDTFTRYTNDVIATSAFGITVNSLQDRNNEFYLKGKDATNFNNFVRIFKMMLIRYFSTITKLIGETLVSRTTINFFRTIIRETVKVRKEKKIIRPDMIHLLMEASNNEEGVKISVDDIVAQAFIFYLAGFATSATVMGFVAHELAVNPEIQDKLREEVDHFTKEENGEISYDTLSKMKYLDMVISETLRKYPPNAMMDRLCVKKYTLPKATPDSKEYTIEPNSMIWLPIYALHHDEKYFPDPEKFDPERFNDENKDKINPYAYIPFGVGPRKCIGNRFALMEIKILFVHLLQNFILQRDERTKHPINFENGFVVGADGEFWIKLKKRVINTSE